MQHKSHYETLQISSSSSADEIKKAFRQLSLQYHPDITNNDELKAEKFKIIKEAYSVLSDTEKRKAYDAKHFFFSSNNKIVTIQSILQDASVLKSRIQAVHPSKINYDYWSQQLEKLLSGKSYELLNNESNNQTKEEIIGLINDISSHLTYQLMLSFSTKLQEMAKANTALQETLLLSLEQKKKQMLWDKYKIPLAIGIAVAICLMIALVTNG